MRIVNIEPTFYPTAGYQINILPKYLSKNGHEVIIVTAKLDKIENEATSFFGKEDIQLKDKKYEEENNVKIVRVPIKAYIFGRVFFGKNLKSIVDDFRPDILFVHGNDTPTATWFLLRSKKLGYPIVSDSHMLAMAIRRRGGAIYKKIYKWFVTPVIIKNQIPVIRTQNDDYVQKYLGIPLEQCPWISYGSDTLLFHLDRHKKEEFRRNNDIDDDDFVILYAGKLDEAKGGKLLAETFLKKFQCDRKIVLIVVGSTKGEYGKEVENLFKQSENRILRFPTQKYTELAKFYQSADLAIFPRQCSLSFYDVQACGLPVIFEDNNINVDRCSHNNGWTFKCEDVDDFRRKIFDAVNMEFDDYKKVSNSAYQFILQNYNYETKAREYEQVLIDEYNRFHERIKE